MNKLLLVLLVPFLALSPIIPLTTVVASSVGVTYTIPLSSSSSASITPDKAERIAAALSSLNIRNVRLPSPSPALIRSFSYTNTSLLLSIPNALLPSLASNRTTALRWLYSHVLPFYPRSKISLISVGNDAVDSDLAPFILPAIRNLQLSLLDLGIRRISVSTTFSFINVVTTPFPPSSATFQEPLGELVLKPLLQFLRDTNSSFLVNLYPYNMYRINAEIPLGFALFQDYLFNYRDDLLTGVRYKNLFDMMVDAVVTSLAVAGYETLPLVVAETGWPTSSWDPAEVDATSLYAEMYVKGLVGHLRSGSGSPLRKEGVAETYIFELVDQEAKQGTTREWGILYANMSNKYNAQFFGGSERIGAFFMGISCFLVLVVGLLFGEAAI